MSRHVLKLSIFSTMSHFRGKLRSSIAACAVIVVVCWTIATAQPTDNLPPGLGATLREFQKRYGKGEPVDKEFLITVGSDVVFQFKTGAWRIEAGFDKTKVCDALEYPNADLKSEPSKEQLEAIFSANTAPGTSWETDRQARYSSKFNYYKRSNGFATATVSRSGSVDLRLRPKEDVEREAADKASEAADKARKEQDSKRRQDEVPKLSKTSNHFLGGDQVLTF